MNEVYKSTQAEEDLIQIWCYSFENWGEAQADAYLDEMERGVQLLARNPEIGKACDFIREGYRRFRVQHHVMYYRFVEKGLEIVRVLHEASDVDRHFDKP